MTPNSVVKTSSSWISLGVARRIRRREYDSQSGERTVARGTRKANGGSRGLPPCGRPSSAPHHRRGVGADEQWMARGAVRRHCEALEGTRRQGREPFSDDLGTRQHEGTHRGATERAPRHNDPPGPADRGRKIFVVPRADDIHTRHSGRHKKAGMPGGVGEQMRHTVGRVAEGQRDAVATAQCGGHSRTTRRRRVEENEQELRNTRLEGEGTADEFVDVTDVPRHIRSRRRHTGATERRTRQRRRQRHGTHEHGDSRQQERQRRTGGQPGTGNSINNTR